MSLTKADARAIAREEAAYHCDACNRLGVIWFGYSWLCWPCLAEAKRRLYEEAYGVIG